MRDTHDESEFLETVQEHATFESSEAARETTVVLETLGIRVPEEAREIASDLPPVTGNQFTDAASGDSHLNVS